MTEEAVYIGVDVSQNIMDIVNSGSKETHQFSNDQEGITQATKYIRILYPLEYLIPQVVANNYIVEVEHPSLGHIKRLPFPMDFSETPMVPVPKPVPQLGEHTEEIMLRIGYSRADIAQFKKL